MQNNWKKNIQSRMAQREISPNTSVWEELDKQLSQKDKKQSIRFVRWYALVAGVALLLGLGWFWKASSDAVKVPDASPIVTKNTVIVPTENSVVSSPSKEESPLPALSSPPIVNAMEVDNTTDVAPSVPTALPTSPEETPPVIVHTPMAKKDSPTTQYIQAKELLASIEQEIANGDTSRLSVSDKKLLAEVENEIFEDQSPELLEKITNGLKKIHVALRDDIIN